MSDKNYATWSGKNVFSIKMQGSGEFISNQINTLVLDFLEPKFGYNGELWDEEDRNIALEELVA